MGYLTRDQIASEFRKYGYSPSVADLDYWSHKSDSELRNLQQKLYARKTQANPNAQLSDAAILNLYQKYGFPEPDLNWVRSNLPTTAFQLENVLMTQSGKPFANTATRQSGSNFNTNKNISYSSSAPTAHSYTSSNGVHSVFPEGKALIKFSSDPNGAAPGDESTIWELDARTKTLRPYLSWSAFQNDFGANVDAAVKSIKTVDPTEFDIGSSSGFHILSSDYGIGDSGFRKPVQFTTSTISHKYGQQQTDSRKAQYAAQQLGKLSSLAKAGNANLDNNFLQGVLKDPNMVAFYTNAMVNGGYKISDVWKDIKRRELVAKGRRDLEDDVIIDPTRSRDEYINTQKGFDTINNSVLSAPHDVDLLNGYLDKTYAGMLDNKVFEDKPDDSKLDPTNPNFLKDFPKIETAFHDILIERLNAETDAQKAVAEADYKKFKENVEKKYNINLSSDINAAWKQIQGLKDTYATKGMIGSGVYNDKLKDYLKDLRQKESYTEDSKTSQLETAERQYFQNLASPEEIQTMIEEDKAKGLPKEEWRAYKWGLILSDDAKNALSLETLKKKFPNTPEYMLKIFSQSIIDKNGNFRSKLYQQKVDNIVKVKYGNVAPEMQNLGTVGSQLDARMNAEMNKRLEADKKKYWNVDPTTKETLYDQKPEGAEDFMTEGSLQEDLDKIDNGTTVNVNGTPTVQAAQTTGTPTKVVGTGKKYIAKQGSRLYAVDENGGVTYIPSHEKLQQYVNNGYIDSRDDLPQPTATSQTASVNQTPVGRKYIAKQGSKLYAVDENGNATYISSPTRLKQYVSSGYTDTRGALPANSSQASEPQGETINNDRYAPVPQGFQTAVVPKTASAFDQWKRRIQNDYDIITRQTPGSNQVNYYIRRIPKATLINSDGERVVVRTDNVVGTKYPTAKEMFSKNYVMERAPGVPAQRFPDTKSYKTTRKTGGYDMSTRPDLQLRNGTVIKNTDPRYSNYENLPNVKKLNQSSVQKQNNIVSNFKQPKYSARDLNTMVGSVNKNYSPYDNARPEAQDQAWQKFIQGKRDILGHNWQGYKKISGNEYQTPAQRSSWGNIQNIGGSLYGYKKQTKPTNTWGSLNNQTKSFSSYKPPQRQTAPYKPPQVPSIPQSNKVWLTKDGKRTSFRSKDAVDYKMFMKSGWKPV